MFQAENVISFPRDTSTTDLLRNFIGSDSDRLEEITTRLLGLEAVLFYLKNSGDLPQMVMNMLLGLETAVRDCIVVADLRPVQELRA